MNKHQEALDRIRNTENIDIKKINKEALKVIRSGHVRDCDTLQELVDKAKSMKPEMIPYEGFLIEEATYQGCPSCKEPIHRDWKMFERNKLPKFCQECGREFDWSEDEPK